MSRRVEIALLHGSSASLPTHLERIISSYLGPPPNMTLSETCAFGSIALLDWMWGASCTRASERTPWWSLTNFLRSEPHYYRWQFAESMKVAAERGDSAVVKWLLEHFRGCVVPGCVVDGAAGNGHLDVLDLVWRYTNGRYEQQTIKRRKVTTGCGETVSRSSSGHNVMCWGRSHVFSVRNADGARWLLEHLTIKTEEELARAIRAAVAKDDWGLAEFLLPPGRCLLDYADFGSPPKMIEWMLDCGYLQRNSILALVSISRLAESDENLSLVRRIADQHNPPPLNWNELWSDAIDDACMSGALEMLQWLVGHPTGLRVCEEMRQSDDSRRMFCSSLVESRLDVGIMESLNEQGLFDAVLLGTFLDGIRHDQSLEVLKWLVEHLPSWQQLLCDHVMDEAAEKGRLDVLQYLQRLQLSLLTSSSTCENLVLARWCTTQAMDKAAASGHLDVVKWLHARRREGCTVAAMNEAARKGHLEIVEWLHVNRSEGCTFAAMNGAAANGHLETVKWLHANTNAGCTTAAVDRAASGGFLNVIKWLYTNTSAGCTSFAMDSAAREGHLETLKWLHDNSSAGCTVEAINGALRSRHFRVASWLHEHFPQYAPAKLKEWRYDERSFVELLFRQQHYGDIFTSNFLQGLKNANRLDHYYEKGEAWNWVKEKYGGT